MRFFPWLVQPGLSYSIKKFNTVKIPEELGFIKRK